MTFKKSGLAALALTAALGSAFAQAGGTAPGSMGSTDGTHGDGSTANSQTTGTGSATPAGSSGKSGTKTARHSKAKKETTPASGTGDLGK
jgi:hypothetical protein